MGEPMNRFIKPAIPYKPNMMKTKNSAAMQNKRMPQTTITRQPFNTTAKVQTSCSDSPYGFPVRWHIARLSVHLA